MFRLTMYSTIWYPKELEGRGSELKDSFITKSLEESFHFLMIYQVFWGYSLAILHLLRYFTNRATVLLVSLNFFSFKDLDGSMRGRFKYSDGSIGKGSSRHLLKMKQSLVGGQFSRHILTQRITSSWIHLLGYRIRGTILMIDYSLMIFLILKYRMEKNTASPD